ncbi:hypothetical protein BDY21DRAFT_48475 [Lineolata rhizophorae]|uniref:Uncharacterized protein n=1 Tax=Lineolata rhizophorae TaxID=578093 RepID=A0A6A6NX51_9PEZI|nr:hypothetical protein BDY21DRAFT_48475 [Lineolata rhizophorae]
MLLRTQLDPTDTYGRDGQTWSVQSDWMSSSGARHGEGFKSGVPAVPAWLVKTTIVCTHGILCISDHPLRHTPSTRPPHIYRFIPPFYLSIPIPVTYFTQPHTALSAYIPTHTRHAHAHTLHHGLHHVVMLGLYGCSGPRGLYARHAMRTFGGPAH